MPGRGSQHPHGVSNTLPSVELRKVVNVPTCEDLQMLHSDASEDSLLSEAVWEVGAGNEGL